MDNLLAIEEDLERIENTLRDIITEDVKRRITSPETEDDAKLAAAIAFTMGSLYYLGLSLEGEDPRKHAIIDDIAKIKELVKKMNKVGETNSKQSRPKLDVEASQRVILHNL